jgi:hypothetical protein
MPTTSFKRPFLVLLVASLFLLVLYGKCCWDDGSLSIRVAFAEEQTEIFEEMRVKAAQSDPTEAVRCLEYALYYYPSGSQQVSGSRLDRMVERARRNSVAAIIADLRNRTGKDLGDDPLRWIDQTQSEK